MCFRWRDLHRDVIAERGYDKGNFYCENEAFVCTQPCGYCRDTGTGTGGAQLPCNCIPSRLSEAYIRKCLTLQWELANDAPKGTKAPLQVRKALNAFARTMAEKSKAKLDRESQVLVWNEVLDCPPFC